MKIRILLLLLVLSLSACSDVVSNTFDSGNKIQSLHVFLGINKTYKFAEIKKTQFKQKFIQQKYNDRISIKQNTLATWVMITPSIEIKKQRNYILELNRPTLDVVTAFIPVNKNTSRIVKTGDSIPFINREVPHENFLFKIEGSKLTEAYLPIFIKIQNSGTTSTMLKLIEESEFYRKDHHHQLIQGLYFGAVLALVLYNMFIYLSVRDISYLWYVGYLGFIVLYLLAINGLTYRYLWPNSPYWANNSTYFFILMSMSTGLGFARSIFNTVNFKPTLAKIMKLTSLLLILISLLGLFLGNAFFATIISYLGLFVLCLILIAIYFVIKNKYELAYFASIGFLFVFFGSMTLILYKLELLSGSVLSIRGLQIGIIIEAFILSFALAYRINYTNSKLQQANQALVTSKKNFSTKFIGFQDRERKLTSETLHDSIGQKLLVTKIQLAQIFEKFNIPEDNSKIKSVWGLIHDVINDVRNISHSLHPHQIDRLTLKEALEDVIIQSFNGTNFNVNHDFKDLDDCIATIEKLHIYRIIQETINNILKHSGAKNIEFKSFRIENKLKIIIKDDGQGVPTQSWFESKQFSQAYGLSNIMERVNSLNGTIRFKSSHGQGFQIIIKLSCSEGEASHD